MSGVLDIVALRSLTAIADSGGFRRAAQNLHLSQAAVSQQVRRLEQACGRTLVDRTSRPAHFTPDGELLLSEARKILAAHDDALERLRVAESPEPTFLIGSTEHAADVLLPAISSRLKDQFAEHAVRFRIDRGNKLNERLDAGSIDASLFIGEARGQLARPAGALPLGWYAAPGWTMPRPARGGVPLVVIDDPCTIRRRAVQVLTANKIESSIACEAGHLAGVLQAARAGMGIALLAHLGAAPEGLEQRHDLPPVEPESLHVRGRIGAPSGLVSSIVDAAREVLSTSTRDVVSSGSPGVPPAPDRGPRDRLDRLDRK